MPKFDDAGKLTLKLKAQSPLIHFQAREAGATIRASEVKPKFDRFLRKRMEEKGIENKELFLPAGDGSPSNALRYKMDIRCETPPGLVTLNQKSDTNYYTIFYANLKRSGESVTLGVFSDPTVSIWCFNDELKGLIEECIEEFFLVSNFGTMQDKGFGSFAPESYGSLTPAMRKEIAAYLKKQYGIGRCWMMVGRFPERDELAERNNRSAKLIKNIECFYHLMKSGYNNSRNKPSEFRHSYLFEYMHKLETPEGTGIGNEKAWMKREKISPTAGSHKPKSEPSDHDRPRYVRALLGTAGTYSYIKEGLSGRVSITISNPELERVPSPVFFKIIGDTVFITASPVDERVYGKNFKFSGRKPEYSSGVLSTPEKSLFEGGIFDIGAFLSAYADYYNLLVAGRNEPDGLKKYLDGALKAEEVRS